MRFVVLSSLILMTFFASACEKTIHDVRGNPAPVDVNPKKLVQGV